VHRSREAGDEPSAKGHASARYHGAKGCSSRASTRYRTGKASWPGTYAQAPRRPVCSREPGRLSTSPANRKSRLWLTAHGARVRGGEAKPVADDARARDMRPRQSVYSAAPRSGRFRSLRRSNALFRSGYAPHRSDLGVTSSLGVAASGQTLCVLVDIPDLSIPVVPGGTNVGLVKLIKPGVSARWELSPCSRSQAP
jgi:hypothetical protein